MTELTVTYINKTPIVLQVNTTVNTTVIGGGVSGLSVSDFVVGEIPTGLVNGSNATFLSLYTFNPDKIDVFRNGLKQKNIVDYTTTGTQTINLTYSPEIGDLILINYIKN